MKKVDETIFMHLTDLVMDLKPAQEPIAAADPYESVNFDYMVKDNSAWVDLIAGYLKTAKTFEIHCWNEEQEWITLALQYGKLKNDDWKYGKIITGTVTMEFIKMILEQPKPGDVEIYNKMTPFFNIFLDDVFQRCHYGTENYYK